MSFFYTSVHAQQAVDTLVERLGFFFDDRPRFANLAREGLVFIGDQFVDSRVGLIDSGLVSLPLLHGLMSGGQSYIPAPVKFFWDRLEHEQALISMDGEMSRRMAATHSINVARLGTLHHTGTLENIFRPPSSLAKTYSSSLVAVDVVKSGVPRRGSAFLFGSSAGPFVVTCKHNVDPSEGISSVVLTDLGGRNIEAGPAAMHERFDLACMPINVDLPGPPFFAATGAEIFDEVFTLGFPDVPGGITSLIGHRGEINGRAELYLAKSPALLISNLVSPGSSGCPVLARDGLCVGMTIRWVEGETDAGASKFSCALPVEEISAFCDAQPRVG